MSPTTRYTYDLEPEYAYVSVTLETHRGTLAVYRIALVVIHEGVKHTVRVYDNAHGRHDLHRHTLGGKQRAETAHHGKPEEARAAAEKAIRRGYEEMIAGWLR